MQSIWKGSISFGLVSIRVQLFAATEERGITFHQVHAPDGGRIRYRRVCSVDGADVDFAEIAKGYQLASGEVIVLTDEDFAELPLPTGRSISVLSFVEADTIDPIRLSRSYYCEPVGTDTRPYRLLCAALERTRKVAVVKVALRGRESVALLRPWERVLVLQLLLWPDEVRRPRFSFLDQDAPLPAQEVRMVESYIDTLTGAVDPEEQVDRYRVAVEQLVEAKATGLAVRQPPRPVEAPNEGVDLMEALRRSVEEAKRNRAGPAGRAAPTRKTGAKKSGAKKSGAKKTVPKAADSQSPPAKAAANPAVPAKKPAVKVAPKPAAAHARATQSPARKATTTKAARKAGPRNARADND
jgi:DNA end-binding protein Ku